MTEIELAKNFIFFLQDSYDLYFEVSGIDIVGKAGNILIAVEVKTSLNFKVIEQAHNNIGSAHYSYIAVPKTGDAFFKHKICKDYGIGILQFDSNSGYLWEIKEVVRPKFNRKARTKWFKPDPRMKKLKAGTPAAKGTITAFKLTTERIERYVKKHQGCEIKDVFENIDHHYSSMSSGKSSIMSYIDKGIITTIRREGSKLYYANETT